VVSVIGLGKTVRNLFKNSRQLYCVEQGARVNLRLSFKVEEVLAVGAVEGVGGDCVDYVLVEGRQAGNLGGHVR